MLCGYKRCGKDTFANYLNSKYNYTHLKISHLLKKCCKDLFKFTDEQIESDAKDEIDPRWCITPRKAMIFVGTNMFQYQIQNLLPNIQKNFWIKSTIQTIVDLYEKDTKTNIVISDLRFIHELNCMQELLSENRNIKISIVKVIRPSLQIVYDKDSYDSETQHLSFPFDKIITNDDKFYDNIDSFMNLLE